MLHVARSDRCVNMDTNRGIRVMLVHGTGPAGVLRSFIHRVEVTCSNPIRPSEPGLVR
jgi:hypothetical protein